MRVSKFLGPVAVGLLLLLPLLAFPKETPPAQSGGPSDSGGTGIKDPNPAVCMRAVDRLTDQESLKSVTLADADADAGYPPPKGKVLMERVSVEILKGNEPLFHKTYLGSKGKKLEPFLPDTATVGGYRVKVHAAEVDCRAICEALLKPFDKDLLAMASTSGNKYERTVALPLIHP
jgi:hypothetical protein